MVDIPTGKYQHASQFSCKITKMQVKFGLEHITASPLKNTQMQATFLLENMKMQPKVLFEKNKPMDVSTNFFGKFEDILQVLVRKFKICWSYCSAMGVEQ